MEKVLCCLNGNNNLGAKHFSRTRHGYKETSVRIEEACAACYHSFYFVNNKSNLCNVSEGDCFLLCCQLLYCSRIIRTCDFLNNIS